MAGAIDPDGSLPYYIVKFFGGIHHDPHRIPQSTPPDRDNGRYALRWMRADVFAVLDALLAMQDSASPAIHVKQLKGVTNMNRFIPTGAETREFPAAAVVACCYDSARGPALVAYKGRQNKPARHYVFPTIERRDDNLAAFVKEQTEL
jgi:hypothetical protein